ncbi:hypothetical protein Hanom_Chr14g01245921 [Helianthus anomalus]
MIMILSLQVPIIPQSSSVAKLDPNDGGSKTYLPKNFYTKTTYITLMSENFGGVGCPFYASPLIIIKELEKHIW